MRAWAKPTTVGSNLLRVGRRLAAGALLAILVAATPSPGQTATVVDGNAVGQAWWDGAFTVEIRATSIPGSTGAMRYRSASVPQGVEIALDCFVVQRERIAGALLFLSGIGSDGVRYFVQIRDTITSDEVGVWPSDLVDPEEVFCGTSYLPMAAVRSADQVHAISDGIIVVYG